MSECKMPTKEELQKMSDVDIRKVNADDLVDIEDVHINTDLPRKERIVDYIRQIKNPYCYRWRGISVKLSFAGERTLEECLLDSLTLE